MDWGWDWRHARKRWAGILSDFGKKAESWDLDVDEASWFLDLGEASPVMNCGVCTRVGWVSELKADDGKTVSIEKLCLSLLVSIT